MGRFAVVALALGTSGIDYAPAPDNPAVAPLARSGDELELHESFVARASLGRVDLLFVGDSITAGFGMTAPTVWERYYSRRRAVNFGIGGDHTQHLPLAARPRRTRRDLAPRLW